MNARLLVPISRLFLFVILIALVAPAPGAHAATVTVSDCSAPSGTAGRLVEVITAAAAGDTVVFSCSGTITLTATITIDKNLTIDGAGQSVTISGGNTVRVFTVTASVTLYLQNLTVANGTSPGNGNSGGGVNNSGTLNVTNSTFSGNSAGAGGTGGIYGPVTLKNTIVADSTPWNCQGIVTDGGGNLQFGGIVANSTGATILTADPKLSALADNGGPTQTMALSPGSAAIDAGVVATCAAAPVSGLDQRGESSLADLLCDSGAYEHEPFISIFFAADGALKIDRPILPYILGLPKEGEIKDLSPPGCKARGWVNDFGKLT